MANNPSYANSHISESSLGSYRNLTITGKDNVSNEIGQLRDTLKYVCAKLEELSRDNFTLKSKVAENEKQISELSNKVESQEITINQLEQKISDTELSVEDLRLKLTNEEYSRCASAEPFHQTCNNESEDEERPQQRILNQEDRLEVKRQMMGALGGFGHYLGVDKTRIREGFTDEDFTNILEIIFLGQTEFNLKTETWRNYDVSSFGYTLKVCRSFGQFEQNGYFHFFRLRIEHKDMRIKFKVEVHQICPKTAEIIYLTNQESSLDERSHMVKVKVKDGYYARWNVTLLKKIKIRK